MYKRQPPGETGKALEKALAGLGFSTVIQPQPERGLRASFGAAAQTFPPEITGAVFALGDMPLVRPETHRQLRQAAFGGRRPAVCRYGAVTAPPLFLPSSLFPALLALPDADTGPRELLRGAASVTCPAAELLDIDTPQALAAAARAMTP